MLAVNRRILIVDDNDDIHGDFRKILVGAAKRENRKTLNAIEDQLFGDDPVEDPEPSEIPNGPPQSENGIDAPYELDSAYQGVEAIEMVRRAYEEERPYAVVFMDVRMPPGIDGIETISRIWREFTDVEMVICTAYSDYSFEQIIDKLGQTDRLLFLTKPFDSIAVKQMALSLTRKWTLHEEARQQVERLKREIAQRRQSEEQLHFTIHHDALTGLANRSRLQSELAEAIERAKRDNTRFALLFIDLDQFNEVIDTLGYQNGERLTRQIAARLRESFESRGTLFCQSDDEFALLLPEIASTGVTAETARQIHQAFEPHFDLDGLNIEVKPNVGIVIYPDHGSNIDMLLRHADIALIHGRKAEQGFKFFHPDMNRYSHERLMLLSDLRAAIGRDELMLYFQPEVDLELQKIVGVEALMRWPHPQHGWIAPGEFIPLAERCGLIRHLTGWALREASRQWRRWRDLGCDLTIALDITALDLQNPNLASMVEDTLTANDMPFDRLRFEISEKAVMEDPEQAIHSLKTLTDMGVSAAIDGFGRGYSSLAYLKTLPVSQIKVDATFTSVLEDANEIAIVRSMIALIHNLGRQALAEGAASQRCYQKLRELGCDRLQGSVINSPAPAGELMLWLKESGWQTASMETRLALH